jgi:hypothetical protein
MSSLRCLLLLASVLPLASCMMSFAGQRSEDNDERPGDGEGEGEGEGEDVFLTTEEVCAATARIVCAALEDCGCDPTLRNYDDQDDCIAERTANCASSLPPELTARLDDGRVRWIPARVDACIADLNALAASCRLVPTAACGTLFADPAALDDECQPGNQGGPCAAVTGTCEENLRCAPMPDRGEECQGNCRSGLLCLDGVCAAPGLQGDSCRESAACLPTLTCRDQRCAPRALQEESCTTTEECDAGLSCIESQCTTLASRTEPCRSDDECGSLDACVRDLDARACVVGGTLGDACSFETPCTPDLRCLDGRCGLLPTVGEDCAATFECDAEASCDGAVCVRRPGLDETCLDLFPRCAQGLGCNPTTNRCDTGGGDGEPCHATETVQLCAPGLGCDFAPEGNICRALSETGGPCTNDNVCTPDDFCDFATLECTPRRPAAAACSAGNECAVGLLCEFGPGGAACRPMPRLGDACSFDCDDGAVCQGIGGICQPQLCVVP